MNNSERYTKREFLDRAYKYAIGGIVAITAFNLAESLDSNMDWYSCGPGQSVKLNNYSLTNGFGDFAVISNPKIQAEVFHKYDIMLSTPDNLEINITPEVTSSEMKDNTPYLDIIRMNENAFKVDVAGGYPLLLIQEHSGHSSNYFNKKDQSVLGRLLTSMIFEGCAYADYLKKPTDKSILFSKIDNFNLDLFVQGDPYTFTKVSYEPPMGFQATPIPTPRSSIQSKLKQNLENRDFLKILAEEELTRSI